MMCFSFRNIKIYITITSLFILTCKSKTLKSDLESMETPFSENSEMVVQKDSISIVVRVEKIVEYGENLSKVENQEKYFYYFPDDFETFVKVFGYDEDDDTEFSPLYLEAEKYIALFFYKLDQISPNLKINKIVNICYSGKWQADSVSFFQSLLHSEVRGNLDNYIKVLSNMENSDIIGFWRFYFDGPHPDNYQKDFEELYQRYRAENVKVAELMKKAFEELLRESNGHGH